MKKLTVILLVVTLLAGCGTSEQTPTAQTTVPATQVTTVPTTAATEPTTEPTTQPTEPADPILELMDTMTLEEKVGQLFIIRPEAIGVTSEPSAMTAQLLAEYPVGGFMLAGYHIKSQSQVVEFTKAMHNGKIPAFVSTDEEGGLVSRFANHKAFDLPKYESAGAVGASGDPNDAREMGNTIGGYLNQYGVNMDFAPVADVNTNPKNPVIGTRAFSSDPVIAAQMAHAMADGLMQNGVIPVYKHFPGHGDTAEDSHSKLAVSYKTLEQLQTCEWLPYEGLTQDACVMIAHVALPKVTGHMTPATMCREIIHDYLRESLGFQGVIITDAMEMGAITNTYSSGTAAVKVLEAGCDMILAPKDFKAAYSAVLEAVRSGTLSQTRIDESVYRILTLKQTYGIL